jgi:hypothetical protein
MDSIPAQVYALCHFIGRSFMCPNMKVLLTHSVPHFTSTYMENTVFWVIMSQFGESQTLWRSLLLPSSGLESKPSKKGAETGDKHGLSPNYMTLELRRSYYPQSPTVRTQIQQALKCLQSHCCRVQKCMYNIVTFLGVTIDGVWIDESIY